ncbi:MAG: SagB/ThcOx family dehydrogenase [candidate division WOR-3 bacterium]
MREIFIFILFILTFPLLSYTEENGTIKLPKPKIKGGRPLMEVLKDRKTTRSFSEKELPLEELSNLLWAAFGINRPNEGKRTAPSAMNKQEIDIYVALKMGLYLYDPNKNLLKKIHNKDIRRATGEQDFVGIAPINLIFVADYSRMGEISEENKNFFSAIDAGFIAQNVYLYCASNKLGTVVRAWIDRDNLSKLMELKEDQKIIIAQTVGYPAN